MLAPKPGRWARLSPLIDELLTLAPDARDERLAVIAAGDAAAADELRALLLARDEASRAGFLATPAAPTLLSGVAASAATGAAAGEVLGAWTLVEPIGEGGMGSVWRARRSDGRFEGNAAVKLLKSGLFDGAAAERFRREGAILARLRHPGIAQLYDAGITPRGQPYLVLELIRGERIDHWCRSRALSVRARIELFAQVLDAVAVAHGQLVIHRDLKPSNILVDDSGRVKLLDFGIARLLHSEDLEAAETALTCEGALALTPQYAAPEQFQGGAIAMSTDVHALGIVLYELLTGAHPSGLAAGAPALAYLTAALEGRFVAPSAAAPALRRELRGDLDVILAKACAAEPDARYGSAAALAEDLRRHLHHEPIVARRATLALRVAKLVRRRPLEAAVLSAVVLAVPAGAHVQAAVMLSMGVGTSVALWQLRRARREAERARTEQRRAEAVKGFIASMFEQAVPREGAGGMVTAADLLHAARDRVGGELHGQPQVAAELMTIVGSSLGAIGDEPAELQAFADAAERCSQAFGHAHPITLKARVGLFCAQIKQGRLEEAERRFPALLADLRAAQPDLAEALADTLQMRSYACSHSGREVEAMALAEEALGLVRRHLGPAHPKTLEVVNQQADTLKRLGRYPEAIALLEPALEPARVAYGARRPQRALSVLESQVAACRLWQGRLAEADALLAEVLADQTALFGRETNETCRTRTLLAGIRLARGDFAAAAAMQREALLADEALHPVPTAGIGTTMWQLGYMLVMDGEFDEGLALFERAEQIIQRAGGAGQVRPALIRRSRHARALCAAGRLQPALELADAVTARSSEADASSLALAAEVRVAALRRLDRLDEAEAAVPAMLAACTAADANGLVRARGEMEAAEVCVARSEHAAGLQHAQAALRSIETTHVAHSPVLRRARELVAICAGRVGLADR